MQRSPAGFRARTVRRLKDVILVFLSRTGHFMVRGESDRVMSEFSEQAAYTNRAVRDVRVLLTDMAELLGLPGMRSRERTLEAPYALRALAALPTGSAVLTLGAPALAVALATLGYDVTATGQAAGASHPRLRFLPAGGASQEDGHRFAAVVALSADAELKPDQGLALGALRSQTLDGGLLVLSRVLERRFDRRALAAQLAGWQLEDVTLAEELEPDVWSVCSGGQGRRGDVVLITARSS